MGIEINGTCLYTLQFADDQAVMASDKEDMEYMVRKLIEEYGKWRLTVNTEKTKYLCIGAEYKNLNLEDNTTITACSSYKYLGSTFNREGTDDEDIQNRIISARKAIGCLNDVF